MNLPIHLEGRTFFINEGLYNKDKLIWYPAQNHEAGGNGGWRSWKYFIKSIHGPKVRTLTLETGVALFIKSLSSAGITTISSCDGHGRKAPFVSFFGRYNACWFKVLFCNNFKSDTLNYEWNFRTSLSSDWDLVAVKKELRWDLHYVLEDTYQFANFFLENSKTISTMKRHIFKNNRNSNRKLLKGKDFGELYDWMETRYLAFLKEQEGQIFINKGD
ncbi:hypothetical protein [Rossellomorea aquimaris]|uniref:hypothetical protein n=1 Tax=Rossellomorea aquimaris TaxID=189382 RepID=UPI0012E88436|nr:hypothetical protein [Rossellomorea aquimaris]